MSRYAIKCLHVKSPLKIADRYWNVQQLRMTNSKEYKISVISSLKCNYHMTNLAKLDDGLIMYGYCLYERLGSKGCDRISNAIRIVAPL